MVKTWGTDILKFWKDALKWSATSPNEAHYLKRWRGTYLKKKTEEQKTIDDFTPNGNLPKFRTCSCTVFFFNDGAVFIWVQVNIPNITKEQYLTNHLRASQSACAKSLFTCVVYTKLMWLTLVSFMRSKDTTGYTPNCNNVVIEKSKKQKPNRN